MFHFSSAMPVIDSKMYSLTEEQELPQKLLHGDCRLMAVLKGEITVTAENEDYILKEQDVLFMPDRLGYTMRYRQNSILFYISFHPCFLLEVLGPYYTELRFRPGRSTQEFSEELCKKMAELSQMAAPGSGASKCELYSTALGILHRLQVQGGDAGPPQKQEKRQEKIAKLQGYINEHYSGATSLQEAAEALQYTPQYLANFIKKNLGKTYHDLLSDFRAAAAETYLRYTNDNISRIAGACGFSNAAALQKAFLEKGIALEALQGRAAPFAAMPPDFGAVAIEHPTAMRSYFANYLNYVGGPGFLNGDTAVIKKHVHVNRHKKLNRYWKQLVNLGPAAGFEQNAFRKQLQAIQRDIGFTYGRVSGLLSLTTRFQTDDQVHYNFFSVFKVIDHLLSIGMKPFLDIDNKPFDIYKADEKSQKNFHAYLGTDEYDRFLYDVLPELIRGCINRYGYDEFSSWKFELWQRYTPTMESLESARSFVNRFKRVSDIFAGFHCGCPLGGPCFNPYLPSRNFEQIISAFRQAEITPDFISVIYFPYIPGEQRDSGRHKDYHVVQNARDMPGKCRSSGISSMPRDFRIPTFLSRSTPPTSSRETTSTIPHIPRRLS